MDKEQITGNFLNDLTSVVEGLGGRIDINEGLIKIVVYEEIEAEVMLAVKCLWDSYLEKNSDEQKEKNPFFGANLMVNEIRGRGE